MKRSLILCLTVLLAGSSAALANEFDQDRNDRPRIVGLPGGGFLGVDLAEVTGEVAGRLKLREERGALVTGVSADTAASKAGLRKDDVIVKWNGEAIESAGELWRHIRETPAGRMVKLGVLRDGREIDVDVTLGERGERLGRLRLDARPQRPLAGVRPLREARPVTARVRVIGAYRMGLSLQSMSPQLAEYFGLKGRNGALVVFVHPDTGAAKAGIKAGDVILSIGGETVEHPYKAHQVLQSKSEGPVEVKVMRDKQERTFTVQLEKRGASSMYIAPDVIDDFVIEVPTPEIIVEPLRIEPIHIAPIHIEPIHIEPMRIAPLARMAVPAVRIAPAHIAPIHIAPVAIPQLRIAPISPPKISIPPLKLIRPRLVFTNPV
jgi:serine protease Do